MKTYACSLLFFIGFALLSCEDKPCEDREYQALNTTVVAQIPYTSGQIVRFKTSSGNEFTAIGDRISEVLRPDAPLICQEYLEVTLNTGGNLFAQYVQRGSVTNDNILQLTIFTLQTNRGDGVQFTVSNDGTMQSVGSFTHTVQHPSLTIDGKTFEQVVEVNFDVDSIPADEDLTQLFYSKTYGIIQYTTYNGLVTTRVD